MLFRIFILCFFVLSPSLASAAISISEVAWMGSTESANHEWVELHNNGQAVDVSGWRLIDGQNLSIPLEGTVPANSHVVLERTSDESAPGSAFVIYTGALVNTGATLKLVRTDGTTVDQVSGGDNWELIGGDNTTKETSQYTDSGWKTAEATPGKGLVWSESDVEEEKESNVSEVTTQSSGSSSGVKSKSNSGETVRLILPDVTLRLKVDSQTVGYVNQSIDFDVEPSGIGKVLLDSLEYSWNFGDGFVDNKKSTEHIFQYPGTYVVTVYANFKRQEQVARQEITILPVAISLTKNKAGDVQINNDSPYEIDISGYRLRGGKVFTFPPRSILLPNQTITIAKERVESQPNLLVGLYDNEDVQLDSIIPSNLSIAVSVDNELVFSPAPQISAISVSNQTVANDYSDFGFIEEGAVSDLAVEEFETNESPQEKNDEVLNANQLAFVSESGTELPVKWPYFALAGLLIIGTVGVYVKPKSNEKA